MEPIVDTVNHPNDESLLSAISVELKTEIEKYGLYGYTFEIPRFVFEPATQHYNDRPNPLKDARPVVNLTVHLGRDYCDHSIMVTLRIRPWRVTKLPTVERVDTVPMSIETGKPKKFLNDLGETPAAEAQREAISKAHDEMPDMGGELVSELIEAPMDEIPDWYTRFKDCKIIKVTTIQTPDLEWHVSVYYHKLAEPAVEKVFSYVYDEECEAKEAHREIHDLCITRRP